MDVRHALLACFTVAGATLVAAGVGCGGTGSQLFGAGGAIGTGAGNGTGASNGTGAGTVTSTSGSTSSGVSLVGSTGAGTTTGTGTTCTGLQCQIHACPNNGSTEISGTILDPAGKNPLYGVVAYVPNSKPKGLVSGASCESCDALYTGDPIAAAISDESGKFTIPKAPDGTDIPLVIQIGKWRRQFVIPSVAMCATTAVSQTLSLPKNGSEGDLPNIAISTGGADTLECLLTRVGVDPAEYVPGNSGSGHIHIFAGGGAHGGGGPGGGGVPNTNPAGPSSSASLWDSDKDMMPYDITLLSCEGAETANMNQQVLMDYTNSCGRVFASHFHYAWFDTGPFAAYNLATWTPGSNQIGNSLNANVVTTFAMGKVFQTWLGNVGALTNGELTIEAPRHNADVSASNTLSQAWLEADSQSQSPGAAQDFSFDTPLDATDAGEKQGRVVFSDMHVGAVPQGVTADYATGGNGGEKIVPTGCAVRDLTAQEKALEFILFNLSSCVTPNGGVPQPPPTMGTGPQ